MEPGVNPKLNDFQAKVTDLTHTMRGTPEYDNKAAEILNDGETLSAVISTLQNEESQGRQVSAAHLVAELAKSESSREPLLKADLVALLVPLLPSNDKELSLQCVRALGNMCYEQDACREEIIANGGAAQMERLMSPCMEDRSGLLALKTACCGFLHNFINGNEHAQKAIVEAGIIPLVRCAVELHSSSPILCNFCYMVFDSLSQTDEGRDAMIKAGVVNLLIRIFVVTNIKATDDLVLSLLSTFAIESDDVKTKIAESSADMHLLSLISYLSSSEDVDDQLLVKRASELLVLVLTGDEAMHMWFDGGNGMIFTSVSEWLHSPNLQLVQSAAFALGNFARDDENSKMIIDRSINAELCKCLSRYYDERDKPEKGPLIHALLGALRNLAIAHNNKKRLLEQGILDHLLPFMETRSSIVTSKLVAVIRLLIDRQEPIAKALGCDATFVQKIVKFGHDEDNAMLKGESTRLLAWLIKNSRCNAVLSTVVNESGLCHLVYLVGSEHAVMQNEGLLSIILITSILAGQCLQALRETELLKTITEVLQIPPVSEIQQNTLTLLNQLVAIGMQDDLIAAGLDESVKTLRSKTSEEKICDLANCFLSSITMHCEKTTLNNEHQSAE